MLIGYLGSPDGAVLMDNTTIYGAKYAYEAWPVSSEDWFTGPLAIQVRSLMDVLEAIILHGLIVVDSSSRAEPEESAWPTLDGLQDPESILHEPAVADSPDILSPLVGSYVA
jgi:hypothetical protein